MIAPMRAMTGTITAAVWAQVHCEPADWVSAIPSPGLAEPVRRVLKQPVAAPVSTGGSPVVFQEQVPADDLDEVEQALVAGPPTVRRIARVPEAERVVAGVTVL